MAMRDITNIVGDATVNDTRGKPKFGMPFDSEDAAYNFYNEYAGKMGFGVRKFGVKRNSQTGEVTSRLFVCSKEGFRNKDNKNKSGKTHRAETRIGCNARMSIKLNRSTNKFVVNSFLEAHNHNHVPTECAHMLPSQRKITVVQATELELAEASGISIKKSYELMGRQAGGRESLGYVKQDIKNYLRTKRQRQLAFGEVGTLMNYFEKQRLENPSFFHAVQLDKEEQITNIFWADAKMILDYGQFGDVVSFDTTYRTNKDNRPLAVFVGFNHHRETGIFGAALMYDETADSFKWLFETFLKCMSNKDPQTIFTDQDAAMAKAISEVMPNTYHRLCTWHIMQNALKKVNSLFKGAGGGGVSSVLSRFMDSTYDQEDDFLAAWDAMLTQYNVHEHQNGKDWFDRIFAVREKWAYAYVRWTWGAGLQSTQISESINSDLKDYLQSDHDLAQFFKHFERVLYDKRYKELEAEYALCQKIPQVQRPIKMLIEAGNIYTKIIFEEFQDEFMSALEFYTKKVVDTDENIVYTVVDLDTSKEFLVIRKKEDDYLSCSCRLFERNGVLCGHAIKILREVMKLSELPSVYFKKRWTRKARSETVKDMHGQVVQVDPKLQQTTWYRSLCSIFTKISSRAAESEETYKVAIERAEELSNTIEEKLLSKLDSTNHVTDDQGSAPVSGNNTQVQAKGFKKRGGTKGRKRLTSRVEKAYVTYMRKMKQQSNKAGSTVDVQPKGQDVQPKGQDKRKPASRRRNSAKRTLEAASSSKEITRTNTVAREVNNTLPESTKLVSPRRKSSKRTSDDSPSKVLETTILPTNIPYADTQLSWMQYHECQPTSFLALLQDNTVSAQDFDLNMCAEEFDNFMT